MCSVGSCFIIYDEIFLYLCHAVVGLGWVGRLSHYGWRSYKFIYEYIELLSLFFFVCLFFVVVVFFFFFFFC